MKAVKVGLKHEKEVKDVMDKRFPDGYHSGAFLYYIGSCPNYLNIPSWNEFISLVQEAAGISEDEALISISVVNDTEETVTRIKTVYHFDSEEDISYIDITHCFDNIDELVDAVQEAHEKCEHEDDDDYDSSIYAQGGNVDNLLEHAVLWNSKIISYETIVSFTLDGYCEIACEPDYDIKFSF